MAVHLVRSPQPHTPGAAGTEPHISQRSGVVGARTGRLAGKLPGLQTALLFPLACELFLALSGLPARVGL